MIPANFPTVGASQCLAWLLHAAFLGRPSPFGVDLFGANSASLTQLAEVPNYMQGCLHPELAGKAVCQGFSQLLSLVVGLANGTLVV